MVLVFIAFIVYALSGSGKVNKERFEHGKQIGALTARDIGCTKAYKIAAIEDAEQRGL